MLEMLIPMIQSGLKDWYTTWQSEVAKVISANSGLEEALRMDYANLETLDTTPFMVPGAVRLDYQ
jgi:hypothetical protein